jgi:hypothetical protein
VTIRFSGDFFISPDESDASSNIDEWKRVLSTLGTPVSPRPQTPGDDKDDEGDDDAEEEEETYGEK